MSKKEEILSVLKQHPEEFISGEKLSEMFQVSRTAIWKHINTLRKEGYEIDSVTNKGYFLKTNPNRIDEDRLRPLVSYFSYLEEADSTNHVCKRLWEEGKPDFSLVIAEEQTKGKGRMGREWIAPKGSGLFMSFLFRPDMMTEQVTFITLTTGLCVANAIQKITGLDTKIKWPNDVIINGKKVCGILAELSGELGRVDYVVVGIGININLKKEDLAEELKQKATSLLIERGEEVDRTSLAEQVILEMKQKMDFRKNFDKDAILKEYREKCVTLHKEVKVITPWESFFGKAVDIGENGNLVIEKADGTKREVMAGDVSVRGMEGYL